MVEEKNKDYPVYEKRVYTVEEIMDILNIGKNAAYSLVNSGVFHYVKVGGHYRISKKSFDNWLEAETTKE